MDFMEELQALEREKGVPADAILDALANALVSAYKRSPGAAEEARVTIDPDTGEITVYGQELDEDGNVTREWVDTPDDFGRIAAQTAKQVIVQRLRDAKRAQVFDTYEGREGDLVTGIVQQSDHRSVILDLGNADAVMPSGERIPYERLERGARVKALILEVRGEAKGPQIVVSRSHPDFIRRLFDLEVPELADGVVEIRAIARDAGHRTKIAVSSNDPNVDPVGACVGARGSRVRQVVNELRGEKVDIVEWREDTRQFIAEALSPAKVRQVILDDESRTATVVVPDHQLSLAIGKEGQNARLAARLSGYRVDIRSETEQAGGPAVAAGEGAAPPAAGAGEAAETMAAAGEPAEIAETAGMAAEVEETVGMAAEVEDVAEEAEAVAEPAAGEPAAEAEPAAPEAAGDAGADEHYQADPAD
ncbi:MAG: transcription termination/antitermination protein NusA [Actinobacteria bacterium]|nr:transcription termination/antitermination protein NusA [Actinomycetota bacterium]